MVILNYYKIEQQTSRTFKNQLLIGLWFIITGFKIKLWNFEWGLLVGHSFRKRMYRYNFSTTHLHSNILCCRSEKLNRSVMINHSTHFSDQIILVTLENGSLNSSKCNLHILSWILVSINGPRKSSCSTTVFITLLTIQNELTF